MIVTYKDLGKNGRLGNQLFQIAATIGAAYRYGNDFGVTAVFPKWFCTYTQKDMSKYFINRITQLYSLPETIDYKEPNFHFTPLPLIAEDETNINLQGYFQSWKYFVHCEHIIRHYFTPFHTYPKQDACAIHVRRGDYMDNTAKAVHYVCDLDYYKRAIKEMGDMEYIVFSDDIPWCKENFPAEYTFVENDLHKYGGQIHHPNNSDVRDLFMMAACSHHIISNSSFSWWAAWLSESKKVIAPKRWFAVDKFNDKDVVPEHWIKI